MNISGDPSRFQATLDPNPRKSKRAFALCGRVTPKIDNRCGFGIRSHGLESLPSDELE